MNAPSPAKLKPTNEIVALIVDYGLFCDYAARLARKPDGFKRVLYHVPQAASYKVPNPAFVGYGIEGLELVGSIEGPHFDEVDVFIFTELGFADLQTDLERRGKLVWGARQAEELENNRAGLQDFQKSIGLPSTTYEMIKGLEKLRARLKVKKNVWVKIPEWRGITETFYSKDYRLVEPLLDDLQVKLGPLGSLIDFMLVDNLPDKIEAAIDGYTVDGQFPERILCGIEIKDKAFAGRVMEWKDIPQPVRLFDEKMAPYFKKYGYRGSYGTEVRIGRDKRPFQIDFCARNGSPPSELWCELYGNLPDIIWKGVNGIMVSPEPTAAFGAQVSMDSPWSDTKWQSIYFPEKWRKNVKLRNVCKVDGRYSIIPMNMGLTAFGSILGLGNSLQAAIAQCKEVAATVEGNYIDILTDALDEAETELAKMKDFGMGIF